MDTKDSPKKQTGTDSNVADKNEKSESGASGNEKGTWKSMFYYCVAFLLVDGHVSIYESCYRCRSRYEGRR